MDQVKIGRFIAERRKLAGFTQVQLAEKLSITDRAVSKWETGRSMPDAALMPRLCELLHITINDLFNGEVIVMEDYKAKTEELLIEMARQKEESDRKMLAFEIVICVFATLNVLGAIIAAEVFEMPEYAQVCVIAAGFVPFLIGCFIALQIEQKAGYYECAECGHKYVPTYSSVLLAPHVGRTRFMKCPECSKKSWNKKVLTK